MRTLLALMAVSLAFAGEWSKSYTVGSSPDVEVRCDDGSLEFEAGPAGRVEARVTTRGWEVKPGEVEIVESQSGDRLNLHIKVPRGPHWGMQNRGVRVAVILPPRLTLRATTGDGSIRASGIGGDIRLNSGDGSITASALNGSLDARTGDGSVTISGRFEDARIHTGDGSITFTADEGSRIQSGWSLETGDGSVRLQVPRDLRADLDAHTGDGSLRADIPGLAASSSGEHDLRGRLNGGGMPLRVRSGDGSITVTALR